MHNLDVSIVAAGFIGSIIGLFLGRKYSPISAVVNVIAGTAFAHYLTPTVMNYFGLEAAFQNAVAFVLGLVGMNALAGFFKVSQNFADAPMKTLSESKVKAPLQQKAKSDEAAKTNKPSDSEASAKDEN